MKNESEEMRNDKVTGLKAKRITRNGKRTISFGFNSKYKQGYDGCGSHTHKE